MQSDMAQWNDLIRRMDEADRRRDERWEYRHPDLGANVEYVIGRVQCNRRDITIPKRTRQQGDT